MLDLVAPDFDGATFWMQFLVTLDGGRRLLFETRGSRPELMVAGTVDRNGKIDPFDVPPAAEAGRWAGAIGGMLQGLTAGK